jgi:uncharacterized protein (UPF0332 family)
LLEAFNERLQADYGFESVLTAADVLKTIAAAKNLLQAVKQLLGYIGS